MQRIKAIVLFGCIALAAVITLAGCATSAGTAAVADLSAVEPESTAATDAAAKLAADINAIKIKPESVKAAGDTVTLTGGLVVISADLVVPEGVTLELSGTWLLLRNAALTVNGTVKAGPEIIGHEDSADWGTINGGGTIYLTSKGNLLNINGNKNRATRTLTLDGVTLVGLADNDSPLVKVSGDVEKGYKGVFILKSGAITGNTCSGDGWIGGGGVEVWQGTFTMEGGEISGNSVSGKDGSGGGGVNIGEGSVFTMTGGEISGNTAGGSGGGVNVWNGTFTKTGGTIYGDTDSAHTPGSAENTSTSGDGHTVWTGDKKRNATAGPEVKLYVKHENDTWTYNDTSPGGVGDTTAAWE
jgi:hypothetical protein